MEPFDLQEFIGLTGLHLPEDGAAGRRATSFASGSNRAQDIYGFASVGIPPGLDAERLVARDGEFPEGVAAVSKLAGTGMPVFLNNGSLHEFLTGVPIQAEEWAQRLELYEHLAQSFGPQLYVVAPDKVNDQAETLARLQLFAFEMHLISRFGAHVLLPMGHGDMAMDEFQSIAQDILSAQVIPAFPMREGITDGQDVIDFVRSTQPAKVHLMGLAGDREAQELLASLWEIKPDLLISQDALLLKPEDNLKTSDVPAPEIWDNIQPLADPIEEQAALVQFESAWRGWMIHQAFAKHSAAHQYTNVEDRFTAEIQPGPEFNQAAFAADLKTFCKEQDLPEPALIL